MKIRKTILKENKDEGIIPLNFQNHYKTAIIAQWNRIGI
jgi:hypothetical protein